MEKELKTEYSKSAFRDHLIYPDHFNEDNKGYRASYFYLHGDIEQMASYDCFNVSPKLLARMLENGIQLATVIIDGKEYRCIVFCQFVPGYNRMKGYAVKIDSLSDIEDALNAYPYAFTPRSGYTPDEYLQNNFPESYKLIKDHYERTEYVGSN